MMRGVGLALLMLSSWGCVEEALDNVYRCASDRDCLRGYACDPSTHVCLSDDLLVDAVAPDVAVPDVAVPDVAVPDVAVPDGAVPDGAVSCEEAIDSDGCCVDGVVVREGQYCEFVETFCDPGPNACGAVRVHKRIVGACDQSGVCQGRVRAEPELLEACAVDEVCVEGQAEACVWEVACEQASGPCADREAFALCEMQPEVLYALCFDGLCERPGCFAGHCNPPGPHFGVVRDLAPGTRIEVAGDSRTFLDRATGLTWVTDPSDNPRGWADSQSYCETLAPGWRLPGPFEMLSLLDFSEEAQMGGLLLPMGVGAIGRPERSEFWTSAGQAFDRDGDGLIEDEGYYVDLAPDLLEAAGHAPIGDTKRAWCVTGQPATQVRARFSSPNGPLNGVDDAWTGLSWHRPDDGMAQMAWQDALTRCEALPGFRLPSIRELVTLISWHPSAPRAMFEDQALAGMFWSRTLQRRDDGLQDAMWVELESGDGTLNIIETAANRRAFAVCVHDLLAPPPR